MRFRFKITKKIQIDEPLPLLSEWSSAILGLPDSPVAWALGIEPEAIITGASPGDPRSTEYLYIDYLFIKDRSYQFNLSIIRTSGMFPSNPRTLVVSIQNQYNIIKLSQSYVTDEGLNNLSFNFTAGIDCNRIAIRFISGSGRTIVATSVELIVTEYELSEAYINEPDGWKEATLKITRDPEFHSLIEFFEGSFIFYGDNGEVNGGYHILKDWDEQSGPDAIIGIVIEYTDDGTEFHEIFSGELDMSLAEWMIDNKVRIPIIPELFWTTFMNRKDTPVSLLDEQDLDGGEVAEPVDDITIDLPSQKVRYNGEYRWLDSFTYAFEEYNQYYVMQVDWDETIVDDLSKFSLPRAMVLDIDNDGVNPGEAIFGLFEAPWDGNYTFDVRIEFAQYIEDDDEWRQTTSTVNFRLHLTDELPSPDNEFEADSVSEGDDSYTVYTFEKTVQAAKGQQFKVYGTFPGPDVSGDLSRYTVFGERRLIWRNVRLATTSTIVLSGEQTIDGELTSGDRVLVKNQGDASLNGIYITSSGSWARSIDTDTASEFINAAVFVSEGDVNANSGWRQTEEDIILDVTANLWVYIIPNDERIRLYPGTEVVNYFKVTADTVFRKTNSDGLLIHDAGAAIVKHYGLGYNNPFYSEILGSDRTLSRQYEEDGCFWSYAVVRGLQLRGYSIADKPFAMSFMDWWNGVNPIFNLGLSYEFIPGTEQEVIETEVQAIADWINAPSGSHPGAWSFPDVPETSVNGSSGVEGYVIGTALTLANEVYNFSFHIQCYDTGSSNPLFRVIVALLDASYNEIVTTFYDYTTHGHKVENFNLQPASDGMYIGIRLVNVTPIDTKTFSLWNVVSIDRAGFTPTPWTPISSWTELLLDPDSDWTYDFSFLHPYLTTNASHPSGVDSDLFRPGSLQTYVFGQIYHYTLEVSIDVNSGSDELTIRLVGLNNLSVEIFSETTTVLVSSGSPQTAGVDFTFIGRTDLRYVGIQVYYDDGSPGGNVITVEEIQDLSESVPPDEGGVSTEEERRIRVEKRGYFYDENPVVNISNIRQITRRYDTDKIFRKILIGYREWQTEDISGIDDPQTKHTYATILKKTGEDTEILSGFIAASLAIEQARRQSIDLSTDYQFDNSTFIIALNTEDESEIFYPELDEKFTVIDNLLNSDARYNIRLTPARNFLRHINWFNIGLQTYLGSNYRFVSGEGNYDTETAMAASCDEEDFDSELLSEKQNLQVTTDILHTAYYYELECPLSLSEYKLIAANRRNAIGVSQTNGGHIPLFIDDLSYQPVKGRCTISGWTKEYWDITQQILDGPTQLCLITEQVDQDFVIYDDGSPVFYDDDSIVVYD